MAEEIVFLLQVPYSMEERSLSNMLYNVSNSSMELSRSLLGRCDSDLRSVVGSIKPNNKKEFGYIPALGSGGHLFLLMRRLGINNLIDLGCGMGFILNAVDIGHKFVGNKEHQIIGYENEPLLLEVAIALHRNSNHKFFLRDILKLNHEDIVDKSIIYWYAPFPDRNLIKEFIDNIVRITNKGQIFAINGYSELLVKAGVKYICDFQGLSIHIK
jgi:hypothetical protein